MKILQETTVWSSPNTPNHTYILNDDRSMMIAFLPAGSSTVKKFKKPIRFDARNRTFVAVK